MQCAQKGTYQDRHVRVFRLACLYETKALNDIGDSPNSGALICNVNNLGDC